MGPTGNGRSPKFNGRRQPSIDGTSRNREAASASMKWTPDLGPWIAEVKVRSRLPLSFKSSSFLLLLLRLLWVCGQRVCVVQAKRHIHSLCRLDPVYAGTPCRHGKLVVHRLMRAAMIVQLSLRTPTGLFAEKFYIDFIPGSGATSSSTRW